MSMTHCHDDKQSFILDQQQFLSDAYRHTKDARITLDADSRKSFTWRRDLFAVERPFRVTSNAQPQPQKKNKKKNKKRTFDEAFNGSSNTLLPRLTAAMTFCRDRFSSNAEQTSHVQQEHAFDDIPFADVATQQRDRRPPIREILLTDYFLRASKLGIQPNVLYTHDKTHPSVIDTSIAGRGILPARCRFLWSDMQNAGMLVSEGTKYSFIVLDPPWTNKSVRRKRPYQWSDFEDIQRLPVEDLIDRQRPSLICCWSTNCDRIEEFIKKDLFSKWKCHYLATWYWLKVTRSGESVVDLNSMDKKSYETLFLAYAGDENRFSTLKDTSKIICSIPALVHSVKPALHPLFQSLLDFPNVDQDRCLELYARNLLPNFTSVGNEVLKHQSMDLFEEIVVETKNISIMKRNTAAATQPVGPLDSLLKTENIFLFIPNIIGYVRVFLSIASFYFMPTHPNITIFCYLTSELLDALDGHAARALGQCTKFGAMFDMLVDRCSTMCLCFVLAMFYPKWALFFQLWAAIDVASHWLHLHAATVKGSESHKKIDLSGNPILRLYYTSRKVLFTMCAGNELWFSMMYMLHFSEGPAVLSIGGYEMGLWRCILYLVTPIMVGKQIISLIHLYTAALDMAAIDEAERASKAKSK